MFSPNKAHFASVCAQALVVIAMNCKIMLKIRIYMQYCIACTHYFKPFDFRAIYTSSACGLCSFNVLLKYVLYDCLHVLFEVCLFCNFQILSLITIKTDLCKK